MMPLRTVCLLLIVLPALWAGCEPARTPGTAPPAPPALAASRAPTLERIAFGSCASQDQPQPFWGALLDKEPDLFLFMGDNIYGDTEDMEVMRAKYRQLAEQPGYQRLVQSVPMMATWDDHDYGVNDGGAAYPMREASQEVFLDFFDEPDSSARRQHPGVYTARTFGEPGRRVQVILLDTRYFRSPLQPRPPGQDASLGPYVPSEDTAATMLGAAQWAWLEAQLRQPAEVRIVASSIQVVSEEHGWEKWANLPYERQRLFRLIRDTQAGGVLFLSGDRHLAEISRLAAGDSAGVGYPLYDVTSSGLNRGGGGSADEPNRHRVGPGNFRSNNFGLLRIDWDQDDPLISLEVYDDAGTPGLQHDVRLSELH